MSWTPDPYPVYNVEAVGDGDTITVILELGAAVLRRMKLRLVVVDTPERGEPGNAEATAFTVEWCRVNRGNLMAALQLNSRGVLVETFGRYMADVYNRDTGDSLSSALLQNGYATVWE